MSVSDDELFLEPGPFVRIPAQISLRNYFAGQALVGLLAGQFRDTGQYNFSDIPTEAFKIAHHMIKASELFSTEEK